MTNNLQGTGYLLSKFKEGLDNTYSSWISFRHTDQFPPWWTELKCINLEVPKLPRKERKEKAQLSSLVAELGTLKKRVILQLMLVGAAFQAYALCAAEA